MLQIDRMAIKINVVFENIDASKLFEDVTVRFDLISSFYPSTHNGYTVLSTVKKYKEIFETNPSNLSLQELLQITNTYEKWEDNFCRIVKLSAELYPMEDIANINAAACAFMNKDADVAVTYLHRVKVFSGEYWNNTGILSYMNGDINDAENILI